MLGGILYFSMKNEKEEEGEEKKEDKVNDEVEDAEKRDLTK